MRLAFLFSLLWSITSFAQVLDTRIDHWSCESSLITCLQDIESRTSVRFAYKQETLNGLTLNISVDSSTLGELLKEICVQHRLQYQIFDEVITLSPLERKDHPLVLRILDASNLEAVPNAMVFVYDGPFLGYTDEYGLLRTIAPSDTLRIEIIKENYQYLYAEVYPSIYPFSQLELRPAFQYDEVEVKASKSNNVLKGRSFEDIRPNQDRFPAFAGESDALMNMQLSGGIQNVGLGDPGLIIRGGGPDQNNILIDGIPVYNTFHILGLYSIFNSSTINDIKLYKDAFPSKYGSRLSSVVDVNLYNGNKQRLEGDADIGVVSSGISLNGPLVKDRLSFSLAARRSYADILTLPVQRFLNRNQAIDNTTSLWYYDVFAKLHLQIDERNQIKFTFYNGGDEFNFESNLQLPDELSTRETSNAGLQWRNRLGGVQWHSVLSPSLFIKVQSAYSEYYMSFNDGYEFANDQTQYSSQSTYNSGISEWRNSIDINHYQSKNNTLHYGIGVVNYLFQPFEHQYGTQNVFGQYDTSLFIQSLNSVETFAYLEDNIAIPEGRISAGMRISRFESDGKVFHSVQPRFFITKALSEKVQVRVAITDMAQFLHLLPNNNLGLPIDIWLPVTRKLEPLRSFQFSTGLRYYTEKVQVGGAIFAKNYRNLIEHKNGSNFLSNQKSWEKDVLIGTGTSYGMEMQLKWNIANWEIASAYTYCRSTRTFNGLNNNGTYFSKYDRPHSLNIIGIYEFTKRSQLIVNFSFTSGNPISIPTSRYVIMVGEVPVVAEEYARINNYRLPATHHLDVAYKTIRQYKKFNTELVAGVYNIYNRLNPFMVYIGVDEKLDPVLKLRSYQPMMPMVKYRLMF